YIIKLFSFCKKHGDEKAIEKILKLIGNERNISKVFYRGDINSFLEEFSSVEKTFCGRFHAMILSMLYKQNFYAIAYSKKMTNVLNDINFKGKYIKMEDFYKIIPSEIDGILEANHAIIDDQIIESEKQFEALDSLLNTQTNI